MVKINYEFTNIILSSIAKNNKFYCNNNSKNYSSIWGHNYMGNIKLTDNMINVIDAKSVLRRIKDKIVYSEKIEKKVN